MDKELFVFNGISITDPTMNTTMEWNVDPVKYYGMSYIRYLEERVKEQDEKITQMKALANAARVFMAQAKNLSKKGE